MKSKDSNSKKSVSYQKKDGRGYDNDKDLKVCFLSDARHIVEASIIYQPQLRKCPLLAL